MTIACTTRDNRFWKDWRTLDYVYHQGDLLIEGLVDPLLKARERTRFFRQVSQSCSV